MMIERWHGPWAMLVLFCLIITLSALASRTHAESAANPAADNAAVRSYDIPAGPLSTVLTRFANQSGLVLSVDGKLTAGKTSAGLEGSFSPQQALDRLLLGSGLTSERRGTTLTLLPVAATAPLQLAPITVDAVLEGTVSTSYSAPDSFAATRTDTPLIETPVSAQSVTRQSLQDTGAETLADGYEFLAGVTRDNTQGGLQGDEVIVRGFQTDNILTNGNRTSSASTLDIANVERLEVVRGPTATLFGKADPGGLINVITKQPLNEQLRQVSLSGASGLGGDGERLQQGRLAVDLGGPLTEDKRLRYRLNAAVQDERSFRQDVDEKLLFISPVIDYQINERTIVNLEVIHQQREDTFDRGLFFVDGKLVLPLDFNVAEGNTGQIDKDYTSATLRLEHEFAPGWKARLGVYGSDDQREGNAVQQASINGSTVERQRRRVDLRDRFFTVQPEVTGSFQTGAIEHRLLLGADFQHEKSEFLGLIGPSGGAIDVFDPDFSIPVPALDTNLSTPGSVIFDSTVDGDSLGVYVQDQIDVTEQWKLLLGLRWDSVDLDARLDNAFNIGFLLPVEKDANFKDTNLSPRAGIVYQPVDYVSVYASYAESYRPPVDGFSFADASGIAVDAETAKNYELGVKLESPNSRLNGTLAIYRADKENVLETDPNDPFGLSAVNLGKVRGEGIEFDLSGEVNDNLSLGFTYAYTDTRTQSETPSLPAGIRLRNIPRNAASAQIAYRFTQGSLAGLRLFGSLIYEDEKLTNTSATIKTTIPSSVRLNLGAGYRFDKGVDAYLLAKNVTDKEYYTSAAGQNNIGVGDPLRLEMGVTVNF